MNCIYVESSLKCGTCQKRNQMGKSEWVSANLPFYLGKTQASFPTHNRTVPTASFFMQADYCTPKLPSGMNKSTTGKGGLQILCKDLLCLSASDANPLGSVF